MQDQPALLSFEFTTPSENTLILSRVRKSDRSLKKLEIYLPGHWGTPDFINATKQEFLSKLVVPALKALCTNETIETLHVGEGATPICTQMPLVRLQLQMALRQSRSLKHIELTIDDGALSMDILRSAMENPNIQAVTIGVHIVNPDPFVWSEDVLSRVKQQVSYFSLTAQDLPLSSVAELLEGNGSLVELKLNNWCEQSPSVEDISFLTRSLPSARRLQTVALLNFKLDSNAAAALAAGFHRNLPIETLIIGGMGSILASSALSFVRALQQDHSIKMMSFENSWFGDDVASKIVRVLCRTPLTRLFLSLSGIESEDGTSSIIDELKGNEHRLLKVELSYTHGISPPPTWEDTVRVELEKHTWAKHYLGLNHLHQAILFPLALERAAETDNESWSKGPNMAFHIIQQQVNLIAQSTRRRDP